MKPSEVKRIDVTFLADTSRVTMHMHTDTNGNSEPVYVPLTGEQQMKLVARITKYAAMNLEPE